MSHQIVIVGGGAGGLELATKLGNTLGKKKAATITLVDAVLTHIWKPLLHEVAAGSLNDDSSQVNFRAHAQQHHFEFRLGSLTGIDRKNKTLTLAPVLNEQGEQVVTERIIPYDELVIAIGSTTNDFGTPGAKEHCMFLDSLNQARRFHRLLLNEFLKADYEQDKNKPLEIAIIGAGATGVELAAELRRASKQLNFYGLHNVGPERVKLSLIEAGPRILPALPERLSAAATRELERLDVAVLTGNAVKEIHSDRLNFANGECLNAQIKVWAAGIKAPEFLQGLDGLESNRINQLKVTETLQTTLDENIFALGDCAECPRPGFDKPVPPRAQAAHQQASAVAKTLINRRKGKGAVKFVYKDHGSLISFSHYTTVGSLMGNLSGKNMFIEGKVARLVYISLYRMHQIAIHGFFKTSLIWLSDRLNKVVHPRIKLH